jgi:AraC-like DNA-binding protein
VGAAIITVAKFDDAGAFAQALSQSNVVCMQTLPGALNFELTILTLPELELHFTTMPTGGCIAHGDTAENSVSFHVPLSHEGLLSLLGKPADSTVLAAYARGGELAVQAKGGARLAYIVPNSNCLPDLYRILFEDDEPMHARRSERVAAEHGELAKLKALLVEISRIIEFCPAALNNPAITKNLQQSLLGQLFAVAEQQERSHIGLGRADRSHVRIIKKVQDHFREFPSEPMFVLDVCRAIGISQPTLFRAFQQSLGIAPKEYLLIRRLHLCRQRLLHDLNSEISVQAVANDFGFWHLGRFGRAYRTLFGEMPSQTLRRRQLNRGCN